MQVEEKLSLSASLQSYMKIMFIVYILPQHTLKKDVNVKCTYNCHLLLGIHDSQRCQPYYPKPGEEQNTFYLTLSVPVPSLKYLSTRHQNVPTIKHVIFQDNISLMSVAQTPQ
jgi:hypothetical protein